MRTRRSPRNQERLWRALGYQNVKHEEQCNCQRCLQEKLAARDKAFAQLLTSSKALLAKIDDITDITTDEFSKGGERYEREQLRQAIQQAEATQ